MAPIPDLWSAEDIHGFIGWFNIIRDYSISVKNWIDMCIMIELGLQRILRSISVTYSKTKQCNFHFQNASTYMLNQWAVDLCSSVHVAKMGRLGQDGGTSHWTVEQPIPMLQSDNERTEQLTFLCQFLVDDKFAMSEIIQYWSKIGGIPVNQVGPRLVLRNKVKALLFLNPQSNKKMDHV